MKYTINGRMRMALVVLLLLVPAGVAGVVWAAEVGVGGAAVVTLQPGTEMSAEELAALMGACSWKFNVTLPAGTRAVKVEIQQRPKTGAATVLAGSEMLVDSDKSHRVVVVLMPVSSDRVRISLIGWGGMAARTFDDAKRAFSNSVVLNKPERYADGAFALIGGYGSSDTPLPVVNHADTVIALKITPQAAP